MRWFLPGKLSSSLVLLGILLLLVMYLTTRFESLDALSVTTGGGWHPILLWRSSSISL